ncbi:MAG: hypothetical protein JSV68_11010, partial [Anaerolineaceae bacterium]
DADVGDKLAIMVSTDLRMFVGNQQDGGSGSWSVSGLDLTSYANQPQVWFAFNFTSDASGNPNKLGALIDNVKLLIELPVDTSWPLLTMYNILDIF